MSAIGWESTFSFGDAVGLLAASVGFGFAWWQIKKTRTAAEAARSAAAHAWSTSSSLVRFDDMAIALEYLSSAKDRVQLGHWTVVLERLEDIERLAQRSIASNDRLPGADEAGRHAYRLAIERIGQVSDAIHRRDLKTPSKSDMIAVLDEVQAQLVAARELARKRLEVPLDGVT